jgi:hypothetical protein
MGLLVILVVEWLDLCWCTFSRYSNVIPEKYTDFAGMKQKSVVGGSET